MLAEYSLRSDEIEPAARQFLGILTDMAGQKARLTVYSQGYLAKVFYVGRLRDRLAGFWNDIAYNFNRYFDRQGKTSVKMAEVLPENILNLERTLQLFIRLAEQGPKSI